MITDLVNQITVQGVISAEWQLIVNCYKEKGDALERENYRGGIEINRPDSEDSWESPRDVDKTTGWH